MLNKRVGTLLALVLASSMVLSGPAAVLAASGNSGGTSQTETREDKDDEEKEVEEEDDVSADAEKDKKSKKNKKSASKNSVSGAQKSPESVDEAKEEETETTDEKEEESLSRADATDEEAGISTVSDPDLETDKGYVYDKDSGKLIISRNKVLELPKAVSEGSIQSIRVESKDGADLTFSGLHTTDKTGPSLEVASGAGPVQIHLKGQNILNSFAINNTAQVTIDGAGVLKMAGKVTIGSSSKPVVINGGNIQTSFVPQPVNGKATLYAISVNQLTPKTSYSITGLKVGPSLNSYSYGNAIIADEKGTVVMYLPVGKVQVSLNDVGYNGTVSSDGMGVLKKVESDKPSNTPTPPATNTPTGSPTTTPTSTPSGNQPDIALESNNKIYWINSGATYRSGASLQFYATGAGYGPEEPQELHPVRNSTRFVPVSWSVADNNNTNGDSGTWKKKDRQITSGGASSGNGTYTPSEYRFKDSFILSTNTASSVPYTLRVSYQKETYNGKKWQKTNDPVATQSVSFYIRNVDAVGTITPTPRSTYYSNRLTTTASRRGISSNARNARTSDDTPIGTMIFLMFAAAGSGVVIFRKKTRS